MLAIPRSAVHLFAAACAATTLGASGLSAKAQPAVFTAGPGAMAVVTIPMADACAASGPQDATAFGVWVDGRYEQEIVVYPGSGRTQYDALLGPFPAGRHRVELRPSSFWRPGGCVRPGRPLVTLVAPGAPRHAVLSHAPAIELRADTVGEQTDLPLYEYAEDTMRGGGRVLRYTMVFTNEDGGTSTRALLARWGRTTDIEQVYEVALDADRVVREEFQGPDHEIRRFAGRRRGAAPILLVATFNNMVLDRGRGIACVRPVPDVVDLSNATRESTLDSRPWAYRVMGRELTIEGRISADAPRDERWVRVAPDPRAHVYFEARLTLDHALAAAWVRTSGGTRSWSHYELNSLAIDRSGWVRSAVAVGADPASAIAELGWTCLPLPGDAGTPGSCTVEATRAFVLAPDWVPGVNLVVPRKITLGAGEEARLTMSGGPPTGSPRTLPARATRE